MILGILQMLRTAPEKERFWTSNWTPEMIQQLADITHITSLSLTNCNKLRRILLDACSILARGVKELWAMRSIGKKILTTTPRRPHSETDIIASAPRPRKRVRLRCSNDSPNDSPNARPRHEQPQNESEELDQGAEVSLAPTPCDTRGPLQRTTSDRTRITKRGLDTTQTNLPRKSRSLRPDHIEECGKSTDVTNQPATCEIRRQNQGDQTQLQPNTDPS